MSKRDPRLLINDMLEGINKIQLYAQGFTLERFITDDKTADALIRNFEINGEAANRLTIAFRNNTPSIEWARIRGFRNRIVHDYFGIDYSIVWQIIITFLPDIKSTGRNFGKPFERLMSTI